jgi:hypothetical protein
MEKNQTSAKTSDGAKTKKPAYRTGRYLKYAIGEIILVMIGILLALQVNNWNEERKESDLEMEILHGLYNDIANNEIKIKNMISRDSLIITGNQHILSLLKNDNSTFNDSLQFSFGNINRYDVFFPQQMAYETLKSKGFHTIKNDSLRTHIIELYDETYFINSHIRDLKSVLYTSTNGMLNKRLFTTKDINHKIPNDFNQLKKDAEFLNTLSHLTAENINFQVYAKTMLDKTISVKNRIENEIQRLNI